MNLHSLETDDRPRPTVKFEPSEIMRLWQADGDWRRDLRRLASSGRRVAVALPDQALDQEDALALERAGLLLIEVPAGFASASPQAIAAFLTEQLDAAYQSTRTRLRALGTTDLAGEDLADMQIEMTEEEERQFLQLVNDAANQMGGRF